MQIWWAEDADCCVCIDKKYSSFAHTQNCVVHCVWVESNGHYGTEGLFVSSVRVWPCWFVFFFVLVFLRTVTRCAFVVLFLPSTFPSHTLSICQAFSLLLQNTWGNTWSYFVPGTGGVISQRSLCWCMCGSGSVRGFINVLALGQAVLCVGNWLYRVLCSSLAHFAADVGLVLAKPDVLLWRRLKWFLHTAKKTDL